MTEPYKIIEVKESVFADNDREAARLRTQLKQDRTFLLNLMSSPGSGKTTTLLRTLEALKDRRTYFFGTVQDGYHGILGEPGIAGSGWSGQTLLSQ